MIKRVLGFFKKIFENKIVKKVLKYASDVIIVLLIILLGFSVYGNIQTKGKAFNVPAIGSHMWMSVLSNSMKPTFSAGDLIIDEKINPKDIKVGDIVTFRWNVSLSTHRIAEIIKDDKGNLSFKTKGDNNNAVDQDIVKASDVIGKYKFRIPFIGYVLTKLKGLPGIIIIWVMFFAVVGNEVYRNIKESKQKKSEEVLSDN